jgi:hypothetical protein
MDNPISFETKKDFIKGQMAEKIGPDAENYYEIQEMATPFADVARYVKQMTETNPSTNIRITHKSIGMTNEQWELNRQQKPLLCHGLNLTSVALRVALSGIISV